MRKAFFLALYKMFDSTYSAGNYKFLKESIGAIIKKFRNAKIGNWSP